MTELFDQVDEHDNPIGRLITKQEAHNQRLIHRCSVIYLFDKNGQLYLQKHKKSGDRLDHSAGGHVRSDESYLAAAKRELKEELGVDTKLKEVLLNFLSREKSAVHMYGIFTGVAPDNWTFKPNPEVEELVLTTVSELVGDIERNPAAFTSGILNTLPVIARRMKHIEMK